MPHRSTLNRVEALPSLLGPGPWTRAQLLAAGWSVGQVERAVGVGVMRRVRRGLFDSALDPSAAATGIEGLRGILDRLDPRAALSHETAGQLHSLWVPWPERSGVQVTVAGQSERTDNGLTIHGSRLPEEFVVRVQGLRVTSPARTAMDLGRGRSLPDALIAVDGAARHLLGAEDDRVARRIRRRELAPAALDDAKAVLESAYASVWSWPGTRVLRQALDRLDPASESPLESRSRGWFVLGELPPPRIAWPVQGASGRLYYADFLWESAGLIGEADGLEKYGTTPDEQRRRLRDQRRRQDDLEAAGWRFVRWVSGEQGSSVIARVRRALTAGPARRLAG